MATYEDEHNLPLGGAGESARRSRRPDLSTFFATYELVDTTDHVHSNTHALPLPENVAAVYRNLANAFEVMRQGNNHGENELLGGLIAELMRNADDPPSEVKGVSDEWLNDLDRVPKKSLKPDESCPICSNPFLEDEYPLVVRLPCHPDHKFDLECIRPWLKVHPTCPLDRKELVKKKAPPPPPDEEEDYDDYYA
ncbi:hypothetical protein EJ06DRAFT_533725 [Trichodelitschia bisporula]|uniref:RING-type domain-containing protein n=1 Tax=Trichodelitschia bisporula TaxID=703511 RepID=A0A6G1HLW6_9PEZI|nr:hypothetical protein EJ06DRAFT_533725 [Trichodelitschia bisporula]